MGPDDIPSITEITKMVSFPDDGVMKDKFSIEAIVKRLCQVANYFNIVVIADFGGKLGKPRGEGLAEQVIAAAFQSFEGEDIYPDCFEKAAMIFRGITGGHPYNDGNKRTGFLTACYYLDSIGYAPPKNLDVDEVCDLCMHISQGRIRSVKEIAEKLKDLWKISVPV